MPPQTRTIRIALAPSVYEQLESSALVDDVGVVDIVRRIIVQWTNEHPVSNSDT